MKQTAVEWLHEQLTSTWYDGKSSKEILEIAKEMEKEQIINANRDGLDMVVNKENFITGEQYYNETFNTKEK
jgi:hypothetical protein